MVCPIVVFPFAAGAHAVFRFKLNGIYRQFNGLMGFSFTF
jgi:hypothetical protein